MKKNPTKYRGVLIGTILRGEKVKTIESPPYTTRERAARFVKDMQRASKESGGKITRSSVVSELAKNPKRSVKKDMRYRVYVTASKEGKEETFTSPPYQSKDLANTNRRDSITILSRMGYKKIKTEIRKEEFKKNPGKAWHTSMAKSAREWSQAFTDKSRMKHVYEGQAQAHEQSARASKRLKKNPEDQKKYDVYFDIVPKKGRPFRSVVTVKGSAIAVGQFRQQRLEQYREKGIKVTKSGVKLLENPRKRKERTFKRDLYVDAKNNDGKKFRFTYKLSGTGLEVANQREKFLEALKEKGHVIEGWAYSNNPKKKMPRRSKPKSSGQASKSLRGKRASFLSKKSKWYVGIGKKKKDAQVFTSHVIPSRGSHGRKYSKVMGPFSSYAKAEKYWSGIMKSS